VLVDIPQPVEDEADIIVPSASCDRLTASSLDLPLSASAAVRCRPMPLGERERLSRANRPEPRFPKISERRSFVCLFFEVAQSSNCAPEMRIGNSVLRSCETVRHRLAYDSEVVPQPDPAPVAESDQSLVLAAIVICPPAATPRCRRRPVSSWNVTRGPGRGHSGTVDRRAVAARARGVTRVQIETSAWR
jgi:hypothetical protein